MRNENMTFAELIQKKVQEVHSKAVLSISPCWEELPPHVREAYKSIGAALFAFHKALIDGTKENAAAVLLNISAFEAYGLSGSVCLKSTIDYAKAQGLIVLADTEKSDNTKNIKAAVRAWIAPVDSNLPEDSPLREGAFDCDAMTFSSPLSEAAVKMIAAETERYGAGVIIRCKKDNSKQVMAAAETIGTDTCGVLAEGTCKDILTAFTGHEGSILLACPTGFEKPEELQELGRLCTLIVSPREVRSPKDFKKFTEVI